MKDDENTNENADVKEWDAMAFADSLLSFGCSMREKFRNSFQKVRDFVNKHRIGNDRVDENVEHQSTEGLENNELNHQTFSNFTTITRNSFCKTYKLDIKSRISSFFDYVVPDFTHDVPLFDEDVNMIDMFGSERGGTKFLSYYTKEDIEQLIINSPLQKLLEENGFDDWYVEFDLSDCFHHSGYLKSRSLPNKDQYISYLVVQIGDFRLREMDEDSDGYKVLKKHLPKSLNFLNIKWFSLQNPREKFTNSKPRLPGQNYPGTGMAREAFQLLLQASIKKERDGIINTPEHFHNAYLYEGFIFLNPEDEGVYRAMERDIRADIDKKGLASVSWAVRLGFLKLNGETYKWKSRNQVFPISERMKEFFKNSGYVNVSKRTMETCGTFTIDWAGAESYCIDTILQFSSREVPPSHSNEK